MVIGLLAVAAIPSTIGVCQALSAQKKENAAQKEKCKFHATVELSLAGESPVECSVVLRDGKLYLSDPSAPIPGHKFAGYYFNYPSEKLQLGLVSTISDNPPMLNWIYVENNTKRLRYAGRKDTVGHTVTPWGWTEDDRWLTLDGKATGFVAAENGETGEWELFYDPDEVNDDNDVSDDVWERRGHQVPILIRRRMELGMESRYVRDSQRDK